MIQVWVSPLVATMAARITKKAVIGYVRRNASGTVASATSNSANDDIP